MVPDMVGQVYRCCYHLFLPEIGFLSSSQGNENCLIHGSQCICVAPWAVPSFQEFSGSDELISGRDGWVAELRQGGL